MVEFKVKTPERVAMVDITDEVNKALALSGTSHGLCNLFVPHTTASVIISENWDPDVTTDMLKQLESIVPREAGYKHSEGNSQAHILSVMLSTSINIPVRDGKLAIGKWQGSDAGRIRWSARTIGLRQSGARKPGVTKHRG